MRERFLRFFSLEILVPVKLLLEITVSSAMIFQNPIWQGGQT